MQAKHLYREEGNYSSADAELPGALAAEIAELNAKLKDDNRLQRSMDIVGDVKKQTVVAAVCAALAAMMPGSPIDPVSAGALAAVVRHLAELAVSAPASFANRDLRRSWHNHCLAVGVNPKQSS